MNHPLIHRLVEALFIAMLAATVTACGGGSDSSNTNGGGGSSGGSTTGPTSNAEKIAQLEANGTLPKLDRSADVKGPDSDGNGVRDDIDAIIQKRYTNPDQRKAAVQYAVVSQAELTVDVTDKAAVKALSVRDARASNCLALRFGTTQAPRFSDVSDSLASYTANTKARRLAQLAYFKALDGTVISLPEGNTCE